MKTKLRTIRRVTIVFNVGVAGDVVPGDVHVWVAVSVGGVDNIFCKNSVSTFVLIAQTLEDLCGDKAN
jgi:hypothetical protein